MEMEVAMDIEASEHTKELLQFAMRAYQRHDYPQASLMLGEVYNSLVHQGVAQDDDTTRETLYYLYKADQMCVVTKRPPLPLNPMRLEGLVADDKNGRRNRAPRYVERFGPWLGVRLHDLLKKLGL